MSTTTLTRNWRCEKCGADEPALGKQPQLMSLGDRTRRRCASCGKKTAHYLTNRPSGTPMSQPPDGAPPTVVEPSTEPTAPPTPGGSMGPGAVATPNEPAPVAQEPNEEHDMPTKSVRARQPSVVDQAAAQEAGTPCGACKGTGTSSKGKVCVPCNGTGQRQAAGSRSTAASTVAAPPAAARGGKGGKGGKGKPPAPPSPPAVKGDKGRPTPPPAPAPSATGGNGGLTGKEVTILSALAEEDMGRKALEELGANSKLLGAATKDGLGAQGGGLEGKGLIKSMRMEGERQLWYSITPAGRKALSAAQ